MFVRANLRKRHELKLAISDLRDIMRALLITT